MFKPGNEDYEVDAAAENLPVEIGPLSDTRNQYKVLAFFVDCSTFSRGESQFEVGANYLGENMRTEYEECKQKARDSGCPLNRLVVCPFPNSSEGDESDDQGVYLVNGTDSVTSRPRDQDDIWQACCACIFNGEPEKCAFRVSELNRLTDAAVWQSNMI